MCVVVHRVHVSVEARGQLQMFLRHQQLSSDTGSLVGLELTKQTEQAS